MHEGRATREPDPLRDLRGLTVLVIHPPDADGYMIFRELQRVHCEAQLAWPAPQVPPAGTEAAFVLIEPRQVSSAWFWTEAPPLCAIVAVLGGEQDALRNIQACNVHAALVKPVTRQTILTNLLLARSNFKYEKRLQTKISRLEETLRVFRKVEQAKLILMRQRTIGENEAYEYLRRQAMNKRVSVATVASAIVDANALLK